MKQKISYLPLALTVVLALSFGKSALAQESLQDPNDPLYYITAAPEVQVSELEETDSSDQLIAVEEALKSEQFAPALKSAPSLQPMVPVDGLAIAQIILKVWDIIQANKPVVNISTLFASALPEVAKNHWERLSGWKPERAFKYHVVYKNLYGMKVVDMTYKVAMIYGGSASGVGQFVASARAIPLSVKVLWGFNLNVSVSVPTVMNVGTEANPIGAVQLDVLWNVGTIFSNRTTTESYQLQGDGLVKDTNSGKVIFEANSKLQ